MLGFGVEAKVGLGVALTVGLDVGFAVPGGVGEGVFFANLLRFCLSPGFCSLPFSLSSLRPDPQLQSSDAVATAQEIVGLFEHCPGRAKVGGGDGAGVGCGV